MTWIKGQSGNPRGRPKNLFIDELKECLRNVEEEKKDLFLKHYVRRAFEKDIITIDLARKLVPDLMQQEITNDVSITGVELLDDFIKRVTERSAKAPEELPKESGNTSNTGTV